MSEYSLAASQYQSLLGQLSSLLKANSFGKRASYFYQMEKNVAVIHFQKSMKSDQEKLLFTINLGVFSENISLYLTHRKRTHPPIEECHWRKRIGFLLPKRRDHWWQIDGETNINQLKGELEEVLLEIAIPELQKFTADESLRDLWFTGSSPGLTNYERLVNLSVLLKQIGPQEQLESILNELMLSTSNKSTHLFAKRHRERLLTQ